MTINFDQLKAAWRWRPISGCPGRFVLRDHRPDLTLEDILGPAHISRFRVEKAKGLVLVVGIEGGGLISYARPDGTYIHTLNTEDDFQRKLEHLGIRWPSVKEGVPHEPNNQRPHRILFVCMGNICRSPMASVMAQHMFGEQIAAESAGIIPVYGTATPEAVAVMREQGLNLSGHRSRSVHHIDLDPFDVIVALTPSIGARLPPVDQPERVVVWDIDDPYGGDLATYRSCAAAIKEKLKTLRKRMVANFLELDRSTL
jgi:protein-tyrosine phosphatase